MIIFVFFENLLIVKQEFEHGFKEEINFIGHINSHIPIFKSKN